VRLQLPENGQAAVEEHAAVLEKTQVKFLHLTLYERERAVKEIERLWTRVENAQAALDAHIAEHGCSRKGES
jgi:hypothetical protein